VETLADLGVRKGLTRVVPDVAHIEALYGHIARTGIFQVAEIEGRIGAVCHASVREAVWFLSGFWVRPGLQKQGLGGPLLARVHEAGRAAGARTFFTWSTPDITAIASYLRRGLVPGYPILVFAGT